MYAQKREYRDRRGGNIDHLVAIGRLHFKSCVGTKARMKCDHPRQQHYK